MNKHQNIISQKYPKNEIIWSTHCHNDYGLAVQNSINAVINGPATQIEGYFNGIGERAGNAALEAIIMIIDQYGTLESLDNKIFTNINLEKIQKISDFLKKHMLPRQPHWPITGDNASKHSSGGHTNAVLTDPLAYQPFDPRKTGNKISIVFGPLSGGNHAKSVIVDRGYICLEEEKVEISQYIKDIYSERRKGITDDELIEAYINYRSPIKVSNFDYSKTSGKVNLTLTGKVFDQEGKISEEYLGKDSALAALKKLINNYFACEIISHRSESDREGIDAESISTIIISTDNKSNFEGIGRDNDIEVSALKALIDAVNKSYVFINFKSQC
jgi:2-isopropylmalate synthase